MQDVVQFNQQIYTELSDLRAGSLKLDPDQEFARLLDNKSVAVVGPARTLIGKKQGRFIDSHDIVVRFNDVFEHLPFVHDLAEDIGTKADVLYCNQVILRNNILKEKTISRKQFARICDDVGIKYIVCTNNSLNYTMTGEPSPACEKPYRNLVFDFEEFLNVHGMKTKFRLIYAASKLLNKWLQGNFGRTGFIAIVDLLGFNISRLYITGMTFYHGGGHLFSSNSVELHPLKNRDGSWARDDAGLGHNSYLELGLMRMLIRTFGRKITVNEDLSQRLAEDELVQRNGGATHFAAKSVGR
jgi:hypothetical protein